MFPKSVADPLEPMNRAIWSFNKGLLTGVIKPTGKVYRFVVVKPVRTGIANFGKNLTYPVRLINNLLQGRWRGARDESYRFVCNSTAGVAGFFDVGTRWNIPKSEAEFGQTLGRWGWNPGCFVMLPVYGPSNERDAIGLVGDTAANPLLYISPYHLVANNPLTWLGPYTYLTYAVQYNALSDSVDEFSRFTKAESDSYSTVQFAWTFARKSQIRAPDFHVTGEQDPATLETLRSSFFTYKDPRFPGRGKTRSALIPGTGRRLNFTFWLQPGTAPVVYIVPGLGSHRLAQGSLALAELVYNSGFSAVCISSAFNSEFMESASTAAMPAYLPVDGQDTHVALTEVDRRLQALYPHRISGRALMGYSMGALHSLYIASTEATNQTPLVAFDRYVAIDTPVRMLQGVTKLDELYRAPLDWPAADRTANMENAFLKVAGLSQSTDAPQGVLPFSAIESRFLIGLTFRFTLRDIIFSSQRRNNQGVLRHSIFNLRRAPLYQEILQYSYQDYFKKIASPYYQSRGLPSPIEDSLEKAGDLRTYAEGLRASRNIRVIVNRNDFLLSAEDLAWLQATFAPEALTVFEQGGHLGNLIAPEVQKQILESLDGLKQARDERKR